MERNMTRGTEWKLILLFTLPLMAGNLLQQLYQTVDGIIVGNFVGESALAAVGTCTPMTQMFIAIALGMSTGASIVVGQLFGAREMEQLRRSVATALILFLGMGVALTVLGVLGAGWLLRTVLGVQDYLFADALLYFRIYTAGLFFQFIYNIVAAILRSLGDSRSTLYFLLISSVCNVALDLLTVVVFHWGIMGAAVATVFSQTLSACVSVWYLFRFYPALRFRKGEFRFDGETGRLILKMGIPATVQQCIVSMNHMAIQRVVNTFDITAGYTAAIRVESFAIIPMQGYLMGMATFTSQNLGAGKPERVRRGLGGTAVMTLITASILTAVVLLFTPQLIGLFGVTGGALEMGVSYLRHTGCFLIIFGLYWCTNGVLQGAGDVWFTMFNTISSLILRTIATYLLAFLTPMGYAAIWWSLIISWFYNLGLSLFRYFQGKWVQKAIVSAEAKNE